MARLPHINEVVKLAQENVNASQRVTHEKTLTKEASSNYVVPLAAALQKIAQQLRTADVTAITYQDVYKFASQLMSTRHGQ